LNFPKKGKKGKEEGKKEGKEEEGKRKRMGEMYIYNPNKSPNQN
jgi:hypothetical protein